MHSLPPPCIDIEMSRRHIFLYRVSCTHAINEGITTRAEKVGNVGEFLVTLVSRDQGLLETIGAFYFSGKI